MKNLRYWKPWRRALIWIVKHATAHGRIRTALLNYLYPEDAVITFKRSEQ